MKDNRSKTQIKLSALKRIVLWHFFNKKLGLILVSEFPKSGGSWFSQMLSDYLNIPFPRNSSAKFKKSILHGHYLYHNNFNKVLCIMRDGRDIMVSAYFHFLFEHEINPSHSVKKFRKKMPFNDFDNIEKNLPAFIKFMFTEYKVMGRKVTWSDFVHSYFSNENALIIRYESLLEDPSTELKKSLNFLGYQHLDQNEMNLTIKKYSFKEVSKRMPRSKYKSSFVRKGIKGDWKNYFNQESCLVFHSFAGNELIKAGYEKDHTWIEKSDFGY